MLSRYILGGGDASLALLQRYADAHVHLDVGGATTSDRATLAFALAHPWLLPSLDAAAAFVRPQALLHRKALLMTAILEASPDHADLFLPRVAGWLALGWLGARVAFSTVVHLAVGLPLLLTIERRSRA